MIIKDQSIYSICTSNQMFRREIWDKFTELTQEISKFQKMNEVNVPQISQINM